MSTKQKIHTLKAMLHRSVKLYGDKPAFHLSEGSMISYRQFSKDIDALGTALLHKRKKGKRIGIIGKNSYEWGVAYLATMNGVGIAVSLDKELSAQELRDSIERVKLDTIFYSDDVAEKVETTKSKELLSPTSLCHHLEKTEQYTSSLMRDDNC